jgi:hypothetical protein
VPDLALTLQRDLTPLLRQGALLECDRRIAATLQSLPPSPFHLALDLHFTNPPQAVADFIARFLTAQAKSFHLKAVYTETNGFDINTSRWSCDFFAYDTYGGTTDFEWLTDWQSTPWPDLTLAGLEPLQQIYASPAFKNRAYRPAIEIATLLVVSRFQLLIARACTHLQSLPCPLLATAHDFDYIHEVQPFP